MPEVEPDPKGEEENYLPGLPFQMLRHGWIGKLTNWVHHVGGGNSEPFQR